MDFWTGGQKQNRPRNEFQNIEQSRLNWCHWRKVRSWYKVASRKNEKVFRTKNKGRMSKSFFEQFEEDERNIIINVDTSESLSLHNDYHKGK